MSFDKDLAPIVTIAEAVNRKHDFSLRIAPYASSTTLSRFHIKGGLTIVDRPFVDGDLDESRIILAQGTGEIEGGVFSAGQPRLRIDAMPGVNGYIGTMMFFAFAVDALLELHGRTPDLAAAADRVLERAFSQPQALS